MKTTTLTAIALIMAAIPAAGFAQQGMNRPMMPTFDFAAADANADGGISADEWGAYTTGLMQTARSERVGARADAIMQAADSNSDGMLNRDELVAGLTARAEEMRLARGEGRGMMGGERRGEMRGHHDGGRGEGCDHDGHGRGGQGRDGSGRDGSRSGDRDGDRGGVMGWMQSWMHDRDQDGRPGGMRGDMPGGMRGGMNDDMREGHGFAMIDQNGDGAISAEELAQAQTFMQRMMERRGNN